MRQLFILLLVLLLAGCSMQPAQPPATEAPTPAPTEAPTDPPVQAGFNSMDMVATMSLEEKVGQLFLAPCPADGATEDIAKYHLGGFVLFYYDFYGQTPQSMQQIIAGYQNASTIPMLMAVDEEGGTVNRVSWHSAFRSSPFPSPRSLYDEGGMELIIETEKEKCALLASLGLNVNLAPVCDITTDPDAFMYSRSLGQSPEVTGSYIQTVVRLMADANFGGVLKHFPGYGNNTDTHIGIAVDNRSLAQLESVDLVPFQYGIRAGCDAIMVSHTFINCLDDTLPASLSPKVIGYLRNTMGFEGVIVTDDLGMQAVTDIYGAEEAAVLAVLAGNDLLCTGNYRVQYDAVLEAVRSGRITTAQLDEAVSRILQWKHKLGLI